MKKNNHHHSSKDDPVFSTDSAGANGNYLCTRTNPDTGMINVDLYSSDHHFIRLYAEVYCREDAQFICSSFNANVAITTLADNALRLHNTLFTLTEGFRSFKTSYSEYEQAIEEAKRLLAEVTIKD